MKSIHCAGYYTAPRAGLPLLMIPPPLVSTISELRFSVGASATISAFSVSIARAIALIYPNNEPDSSHTSESSAAEGYLVYLYPALRCLLTCGSVRIDLTEQFMSDLVSAFSVLSVLLFGMAALLCALLQETLCGRWIRTW